jgi:hypothetical protein
VLRRTDDGPGSDRIDANAIPKLTSETLAARSANIDAVSGYLKSRPSALDQAA